MARAYANPLDSLRQLAEILGVAGCPVVKITLQANSIDPLTATVEMWVDTNRQTKVFEFLERHDKSVT
jgi:hypothetical protein